MYNIIVDGHCDTLQRAFDENLSIFNTKFDFNMTNAEFVKPYIQFLASFINTKYDIGNTAYVRVNEMLDKFYKEYNENSCNFFIYPNLFLNSSIFSKSSLLKFTFLSLKKSLIILVIAKYLVLYPINSIEIAEKR